MLDRQREKEKKKRKRRKGAGETRFCRPVLEGCTVAAGTTRTISSNFIGTCARNLVRAAPRRKRPFSISRMLLAEAYDLAHATSCSDGRPIHGRNVRTDCESWAEIAKVFREQASTAKSFRELAITRSVNSGASWRLGKTGPRSHGSRAGENCRGCDRRLAQALDRSCRARTFAHHKISECRTGL